MTDREKDSRLGRLIAGANARVRTGGDTHGGDDGEDAGNEAEHCELCSEMIPEQHKHLLDLSERSLSCVCRACSLLFDSSAAGAGHYRLVPDRRWYLHGFQLDEPAWESLRIPVEMAFFHHDSAAERVVAYYPSPAGAVESLLDLAMWSRIEQENPVLAYMELDVEALLVNRSHGTDDHYLVPIDDCYTLVGLIRTGWTGFTGGKEVWDEIDRFFGDLRARARIVEPDGARVASGRT